MTQNLSSKLQEIYDLALASGNMAARVVDSPHVAIPLTIVLKEPLHRAQIESQIAISPPVRWFSNGQFAGYMCDDTRQSIQGPAPDIAELVQDASHQLSPNLQSICDFELALGNAVESVDEPAGDRCSLAITFKNPLHRTEITSKLAPPSSVRWLENHDPHYPITGGYKCDETSHAIVGPLSERRGQW